MFSPTYRAYYANIHVYLQSSLFWIYSFDSLIYLADTLKAGQKAAAGKKLDEAKKATEDLKKKASGSVEDLYVKLKVM